MASSSKDEDDAQEQLARLQREFERLMRAFDTVTGHEGDTAKTDDADIDPELERDMQKALAGFLAKVPPEGLAPELQAAEAANDPQALKAALEKHVKPLFDAIFGVAEEHAKTAATAGREGRTPGSRTAMTLDLSGILEDDDEGSR